MLRNKERYDNFLSTYNFYSNSIEFRISSSRALEKWKNVQSFQLNQLVNGKFFFPADRREILLLKYEIWSRWVYEVENFCIELSGQRKYANAEDIEYIVALAMKAHQKAKDVILSDHPQRFDQNFAKVWLEIHDIVFDYMVNRIQSTVNMHIIGLFQSIVDLSVSAMQYTLTEIHELDMIFCKGAYSCSGCPENEFCPDARKSSSKMDIPFVIVNDFSGKYFKDTGECIIMKRLDVYKRHFGFRKIYVKNYTDDCLNQSLIERIESCGFEIDFRKSLTKS